MKAHFDPLKGPYTLDDVGVQLYVLNQTMSEMLRLMHEDSRLDGTTITNVIVFPAGAPVLKIDFVEAKHVNIPAGVTLDVPLVPVQQLFVDNAGPSTVRLSTNKTLNQFEAASQLLAGQTRTISLRKRAIRQLNLVPSGGAATVLLEVLV